MVFSGDRCKLHAVAQCPVHIHAQTWSNCQLETALQLLAMGDAANIQPSQRSYVASSVNCQHWSQSLLMCYVVFRGHML